MKKKSFAQYIDHTILKPNINFFDVLKIGQEVSKYGFASACIPPNFVFDLACEIPEINICTVISFPFGYSHTQVKLNECKQSIEDGADELDLVVNVTDVKSGKWQKISSEMKTINEFIHSKGKIVKWIFENSYLTSEEIVRLCNLCNETKPDFAKTSTGFGNYGARKEDVILMRKYLNQDIKIKASGGIKTFEEANEFINLGASRIGASSGINIIDKYNKLS